MRFLVDDDALSLTIELDDEAVDLSTGTGAEILRYAAHAMYLSAMAERSTSGGRWAPLKADTVRQKGYSTIGIQTGQMVADLLNGTIEADARQATWTYPAGVTFGRAHGFHNGRPAARIGQADPQPARPLIGWTDEAREFARQALGQ